MGWQVRFDSKLYFLSSGHVPGVQDTRIPRVFKDSLRRSMSRKQDWGGGEGGGGRTEESGGEGGKGSEDVRAAPKAVILRALTYEY